MKITDNFIVLQNKKGESKDKGVAYNTSMADSEGNVFSIYSKGEDSLASRLISMSKVTCTVELTSSQYGLRLQLIDIMDDEKDI